MYMCPTSACKKTVLTEDGLIEHTKTCRPTTCPVCGYQSKCETRSGNKIPLASQVFYVQRHMLTHTKEQPFICEYCGQCFSQANNLRGHMRQHTGYKPFICEHCGLSFTHNVSMRKHFCETLGRRVEPLDFKQKGVGRPNKSQKKLVNRNKESHLKLK